MKNIIKTDPNQGKNSWGHTRTLPSGNIQASYIGLDNVRYNAPHTFGSMQAANWWLMEQRKRLEFGEWQSPRIDKAEAIADSMAFTAFAHDWVKERMNSYGEPIRPSTKLKYEQILNKHILPTFGKLLVKEVTPLIVRNWYKKLDPDKPTLRSQSYRTLKSIMQSACDLDDYGVSIISTNPCRIKGAGNYKNVHKCITASFSDIDNLAAAMPEHLRLTVYLGAFCGLRRGEVMGLKVRDVDIKNMVVTVRQQVRKIGKDCVEGPLKNRDGSGEVTIPEVMRSMLQKHMEQFADAKPTGWVFPGSSNLGNVSERQLYGPWMKARVVAGREDLRFHDLRKTCATMVAENGGTLADVMERLRDKTPEVAMGYIQAAQSKQRQIADMFSRNYLESRELQQELSQVGC